VDFFKKKNYTSNKSKKNDLKCNYPRSRWVFHLTETQVRISSLVDCVQERFVRRLVIFYFFIFVCVATLPSLYVLIPYLGMRERDGFFYIIFVVILGFFFFKSGKLDRLSTNLKNFNRNLFKKACELNWTCLILKNVKTN
jgi:hypothetical protein